QAERVAETATARDFGVKYDFASLPHATGKVKRRRFRCAEIEDRQQAVRPLIRGMELPVALRDDRPLAVNTVTLRLFLFLFVFFLVFVLLLFLAVGLLFFFLIAAGRRILLSGFRGRRRGPARCLLAAERCGAERNEQ